MDLWTWIGIPFVGGVIGWVTNWIAVKMIFRPIRARRILGFRLQGLVGRRQPELAAAIGRVVGEHLVEHQDIVRSLERLDLESLLATMLQRGLEPKVQELRSLPLIGGFLTEDRVREIRDSMGRSVLTQRAVILDALEQGLAKGLDVPRLVETKVAAFAVEKLESLILEIAARELTAIVWLGGVLGVLIGFGQAWLSTLR